MVLISDLKPDMLLKYLAMNVSFLRMFILFFLIKVQLSQLTTVGAAVG